jgi:hypothetical protein
MLEMPSRGRGKTDLLKTYKMKGKEKKKDFTQRDMWHHGRVPGRGGLGMTKTLSLEPMRSSFFKIGGR